MSINDDDVLPRLILAVTVGMLIGLGCGTLLAACPGTTLSKQHYDRGHCEALGGKIVDDKCMHVTPLEEK
jgi:hypothetical protein